MPKVTFRTSDFRRQVSDSGSLVLKNRYFEQNPFLTDDEAALLARPGMKMLTTVGSGPIRGMGSEAGSFDGDLFVASGGNFYRMDNLLVSTLVHTGLFSPDTGVVKIAITATIGETPEYCFFADGRNLFVYIANGYATNSLTGSAANTDVVRLDTMYYQFTNGSVDAGTPDGTSGNPWLVNLGADNLEAFTNLANAVNAEGVAGTDYSSSLDQNPSIQATGYTSTLLPIRAKAIGALGNGLPTTETGAGLAFSDGATTTGGGDPDVLQVFLPEDVGCIDVAVINSFVVVIPVQADGYQGRFYWIEPGEVTIDPLNFATAERSPDGVYGVQVFGDQFWLPGESTTEVWYFTGDAVNPVARLKGVVFDRGSWLNTAKAVHEVMVIVDADGGVFLISGGAPSRVSTPDIEEEIRRAISLQQNSLI